MRISPIEPNGPADLVIDQYQTLKYHESDQYSPGKVGRRWFGNRFDIENQQEYIFDFPGRVVPTTKVKVGLLLRRRSLLAFK